MDAAIDLKDLTRRFGELSAVDGLSLQVYPGQIYGLVGPDGAGKTTTLRLLCGALRITSGEARVAGFDVARQTDAVRERIGYMPQRFALYEELTVLENIRFFAEVRGIAAGEWLPRSMEILRFVGMDEFAQRRAGQLSGGMKQKLGLAVALMHQPPVLLLDEPTTGVDPVTRQDFWQLLIRLVTAPQPVAVLVSTPYMDEASRCQRVGFLRGGSLLVEGTPDELRASLNGRVIEWLGEPVAALRHLAQQVEGVQDVQAFGDRLHLRVEAGEAMAVIERLQAVELAPQVTSRRLRLVTPHLEDVFMALLEGEQPGSVRQGG